VRIPITAKRDPTLLRIYERPDFGGQMMEFTDDCPNVYDRFRYNDIFSCNVMEGYWIFYEQPNYRGRQYFLRPGEYRRFSDWGGFNSSIGSFRLSSVKHHSNHSTYKHRFHI
uniref:Beta/gamma crystallin 'Greek key' domain-containing protein n=1 Tax=Erpetoichthys calabaricus TaxID=27687 RepID=A0A8C4RUA0_ERPCA